MFERHKANKAAKHYRDEFARWQVERDAYAELLRTAESFEGVPADDGLLLEPQEVVYAKVAHASLVEDRATGHWQSGSHGISVPIGTVGGRSVRYRVGSSRGHYVQGSPIPTAIDTGTIYVTNLRVVFVGARETRECLFSKLIGFRHSDETGTTTLSVSNRQKPTVLHYGPEVAGWFDFRLDLALAHFRHEVPALVERLRGDLSALDAAKPTVPVS